MNKKKNFIKFVLFILILVIILKLPSSLLMKKSIIDYNNILYMNGINNEDKNSIAVITIGDSLVSCSVDPKILNDDYNISAYSLGTNGQKIYQTYSILNNVLKNQKPKVLLMAANLLYKGDDDLLSGIKLNIDSMFPIFFYHDIWKYEFIEYTNKEYGDAIVNNKGYLNREDIKSVDNKDYMKKSFEKAELPERSLYYYYKIKKICENNNIKLVLFNVPTLAWNDKYHNGIEELAKQEGLEYLDLNYLVDIDWLNDTPDEGDHLNCNGAIKVTNCLGKYLKSLDILN